jgi:hypothetical protein
MNKLNNIVVVGKKDYIIAVNFCDFNDKKPDCVYYSEDKLPKNSTDQGSTAINSLYVVINYLTKIKAQIENKEASNVSYVVVPDILYDKISKGTYKNWVLAGGYLNSEKEIDQLELQLWTKFLHLYKDLFAYVEFKRLSLYNVKKPKFNVNHVKYVNNVIGQCWELISIHEKEQLNAILDLAEAEIV